MGIHKKGWDFFYLKLKKLSQTAAKHTTIARQSNETIKIIFKLWE